MDTKVTPEQAYQMFVSQHPNTYETIRKAQWTIDEWKVFVEKVYLIGTNRGIDAALNLIENYDCRRNRSITGLKINF